MDRCRICLAPIQQKTTVRVTLFCGRKCFGLSRRKGKTAEQKKVEKAAYDVLYRLRDPQKLKERKAAYFQRTYDPIQAAKDRKKIMARHVEYCRQPEYKKWKEKYDKMYRAKKCYGEFWESGMLLLAIDKEIDERATFGELAAAKGNRNKSLERKRDYVRINGNRT